MLRFLKILTLSLILLSSVFVPNSRAQNFVGVNEGEIVKSMDKSMPSFTRQKGVVNETWNYLKYESRDGLQTLLFFLDNKGRCTEVRHIFDRSLYSEKVSFNNEKYRRVSDNSWIEIKGRKEFSITLTDDTWFYTMRIREKEKR